MTTIAIRKYKDRIELVSDSLGNDGGVANPRKKIYSKNPSFIFGHAGTADQGQLLDNCFPLLTSISSKELYNFFHTIKDRFTTDGDMI